MARATSSPCSRSTPRHISRVQERRSRQSRRQMIEGGRLAVTYLRPLDLSVDEMLADIQASVERVGRDPRSHRFALRLRGCARTNVSGRLSRVAISPCWRAHRDRRHGAHDRRGHRRAPGWSVYLRARLVHHRRHPGATIRRARWPSAQGAFDRQDAGSDHATDFRMYRLTSNGAVMGASLSHYRKITTGIPELADDAPAFGSDG